MHTPNVTTSGAMTLKSGFLLVVMAVLASWKLCAADAVRGRYRLRSLVTGLEVDPAAQKRLGSLTFRNKADINSTKGKFSFGFRLSMWFCLKAAAAAALSII